MGKGKFSPNSHYLLNFALSSQQRHGRPANLPHFHLPILYTKEHLFSFIKQPQRRRRRRRRRREKMTADYLPQEILVDIFHRLPIKSIGSCICVSKYWLSIIKTPDFVADNFNIQQTSPRRHHPLFLVRLCSGPALNIQYSLRYDDDYYFTRYSKVRPPFEFNNHSFSIVGSCRGLVCLMHNLYTYDYTVALWNPSIGKTFNLPLPGVTFDTHGAFEALLGFGFDSFAQDYKVVRVLRLLERDDVEIEVEVFSFNARSWKRVITPRPPQYSIVERGSQAFVNGSVHWVATTGGNDSGGRDKSLIVGFRLGDERFRELELPETLEMESPIFLTLSPYKESTIAVFRRNYLTRSDNEIWVMSEYGRVGSWVRLLTVGMYGDGVPRALGFRGNGEVLFELSGGEIVSGDPESFEVRELGLRGEVGYSVLSSFQETLALLDTSSACCDYI